MYNASFCKKHNDYLYMKKIYFILIALSYFTVSCSNIDDELRYSCNEKIDSWVKENFTEIQKMGYTEILEYDMGTQKAIYNAMSLEQRYNLWITKLNNVLKLEWNEKEEEHLNNLLIFIENNKMLFDNKKNDDINDEFELFMYKWKEYAKNELGWDQMSLYSIYCTLITPTKKLENDTVRLFVEEDLLSSNIPQTRSRTELIKKHDTSEVCYCSTSSDYCGNNNSSSTAGSYTYYCSSGCRSTGEPKGCGILWQYECDGGCDMYYTPVGN